jgi:DnaD/phage-associated family protein
LVVEEKPFAGFPAGALATAVPSLFFTALLPRIDDPAELVVTVYFFFAHARKKGQPRFLTYAELAADGTLAAALESLGPSVGRPVGPDGALRRGLNAAVERGTLLRLAVEHDDRGEELFFLNTPAGRRAVAAAGAGELDVGRAPSEIVEGRAPLPSIFALYEENIGTIGPLIAEELKDAEARYPREWIEAAFREAVSLNKRSWSYVAAILRRWEAEGPDYEKAGRDTERDRGKRSPFDRYRHLIQR